MKVKGRKQSTNVEIRKSPVNEDPERINFLNFKDRAMGEVYDYHRNLQNTLKGLLFEKPANANPLQEISEQYQFAIGERKTPPIPTPQGKPKLLTNKQTIVADALLEEIKVTDTAWNRLNKLTFETTKKGSRSTTKSLPKGKPFNPNKLGVFKYVRQDILDRPESKTIKRKWFDFFSPKRFTPDEIVSLHALDGTIRRLKRARKLEAKTTQK